MSKKQTNRIAVDIGGTFTDVVLDSAAGKSSIKLLTTHQAPADAVLAAIHVLLEKAALKPAEIETIIHGTTLAANTIIERRGAHTALLVTEGHRDALETGYENRFDQYDLNIVKPAPLVARRFRWPVQERMSADGKVLLQLDESNLDEIINKIQENNIESVAVGFLHSYSNPQHEQRVAEILHAALPDLCISQSSEVSPQIREYDRLSTTVANAYIQPLMAGYLRELEQKLEKDGLNCPLLLVMSTGGLTTADIAARFPVRLVESGPAGGAILAADIARQANIDQVISFDMGGTTAKLCLINKGEAQHANAFEIDRLYRFTRGSGLPLSIPTIEMVEIGAGGGSIAHLDELQRLRVGPRSAGSQPGPACYAQGGTQATVSDADLLLGRIDPAGFASGQLELSTVAAEQAIHEHIAKALNLDLASAAAGISEVVDEAMSNAARVHAVESGQNIAERTLVAFGGAAPLHAARLAEKLGINTVIIPFNAGVGSAAGFLLAPISFELNRSQVVRLSELTASNIVEIVDEMKQQATSLVKQAINDEKLQTSMKATMRYCGQGHEVEAAIKIDHLRDASSLRKVFEDQYGKLYGRLIGGVEIEIVTLVVNVSEIRKIKQSNKTKIQSTEADVEQKRKIVINQGKDTIDVPCYSRDNLLAGKVFVGPALILEEQTTTVVPVGMHVEIDEQLHIVMQSKKSL